ncbi:MAG: hypothetical protein VX313_04975, partial [Bacteroidota bacterium]|nr:hypothetical protein [Bacteroidota bacterium]
PSTIRSRCSIEWTKDHESLLIDPASVQLVEAAIASDYMQVILLGTEIISEKSPKEMLVGFGNALSEKSFQNPQVAILWSRVREALMQKYTLSKTEALGVICI